MSWSDLVNGSFELLGGFFQLWNCWVLLWDRQVAGVDWRVTAFFSSWGVWNLLYYPLLNQWASFLGGLILVLANLLWVGMALWFKKVKKQ